MIDKCMVVSQKCIDEDVPGSYSETCITSPPDGNQIIDMKVEDVTDIQVKEDPMPVTFPVIKGEQEVSFISVCTLWFRLALGPTQPPVQWVLGVLSPGVKCGRGTMLTTHPHLVPRLRMSRSHTSSLPRHLHGV
jgi:hypothetical protein